MKVKADPDLKKKKSVAGITVVSNVIRHHRQCAT